MAEHLFISADTWMDQVCRALAEPATAHQLTLRGLDAAIVLAVAQVEADEARPSGISALSHEQLAQLAGVSRPDVLRARIFLIDFGFQSLSWSQGEAGRLERVLHCASL
jgi:response regulator of citrate/malate metabolism